MTRSGKAGRALLPALAFAACVSVAGAFEPVALDWKIQGDLNRDAVSSRESEAVPNLKVWSASYWASDAVRDGLEELVFRSFDFGEDTADIKRYPYVGGLMLFVR